VQVPGFHSCAEKEKTGKERKKYKGYITIFGINCFFFSFGGTGALPLQSQVFYWLSHTFSPFYCGYFGDRVL
jgi:hypothetical protein